MMRYLIYGALAGFPPTFLAAFILGYHSGWKDRGTGERRGPLP